MPNSHSKSLKNSQTSPPNIDKISNSGLENSTNHLNQVHGNPKNRKLQKLNWQNSHRKNEKKPKLKKKYEAEKEEKRGNFNPSNNYKNWQNNQNNSKQSENSQEDQQNSTRAESQTNSFPSFYQKKTPNLSKFQNNIQNIAQNLNAQINQIPNKINQNLPSFEQNSNSQINNLQNDPNFLEKQINSQQHFLTSSQNNSIDSQNEQNSLSNFGKTFNSNSEFKFSANNKAFNDNFLQQKNNFQINSPTNFQNNSNNSDFINADNYKTIQKNFRNNSTTVASQFAVRHTYRAGAIVWVKYRGENYYVVFRSLTRPSRGIQLPGGRIERMENVADAVTREVYEEIGIQTRILCPLGYLFTENPTDNFSRMEIYYIVRPIFPIDVFRYWQHQDLDEKRQAVEKRQTLECWCVPCTREVDFLSFEQGKAVLMFREWLGKHKKPELEHTATF